LGFEVSVAAAPPRGTAQPSLLDQPTMLQLVVVIVVGSQALNARRRHCAVMQTTESD
jgi:hypothetical protein